MFITFGHLFSDELANTNAFISSQIDEAGQQIIVVTANDDGKQIETTADALIDEAEPSTTGGLEPPAKKIRIQHQDGQTFILAVSGINSCIHCLSKKKKCNHSSNVNKDQIQ